MYITEEQKELIKYVLKLETDLNWYKRYGSYINSNHSTIDAEAAEYADGVK